nr:SMEK domain-containing protein [Rhizobium ruizarguesonis]
MTVASSNRTASKPLVKDIEVSIIELADRLSLALSVHAVAGSSLSAINRTDRALAAEDIIVPVLKVLYDWTALQNPNIQNPWTEGFDLIDHDAKIAVQVTLDKSVKAKIRDSLAGFASSRPSADYRQLYFLVLRTGMVLKRKTFADIAVPDGIDFLPPKHVIEIKDLVARTGAVKDYDSLEAMVEELEKAVGLTRARDRYNIDAIAVANDLVVTLSAGFRPRSGEGYDRGAWREAAGLLEDYQRAGSVARLRGEANAASRKFVDHAELAIEHVRLFTERGSHNVNDFSNAITAWAGVRDAQWELAGFDEQATIAVAEKPAPPRGLFATLRKWFQS